MAKDSLEKAFLAELEAIEKFRISYTGMYPSVPLAREDPDVRRLVEAMAMFTARTRIAAERNVAESMLRIFRQHFPFLLSPVPAMTMLRASPSSRYVDVTEVPRNTEVYVVHRPGKEAPDQIFRFRTLSKLRILPIKLDGIDIFRVRGRGYRILFRFASSFRRNDEIGDISLYVNHLNDYLSSLLVLHELKVHLKGASVVFDRSVGEETEGVPCEISFGAGEPAPDELHSLEHPLSQARAFLRFPQQELYLNIHGIRAPRNWEKFTVCLDVDEMWPTELRLSVDAFQLHAVPIVNVVKAMANPVECDGTQERWPVRHPDGSAKLVPHSMLAVYRMSPEGLVPLEPAILGIDRDSYEAHVEGAGETRTAWVKLNLPNAFDDPERVAIDALWHQPFLSGLQTAELKTRLSDRLIDGVSFSCFGPLVGHADSELEDDREALLQLLSIKNQRFLGLDELTFLLRALGAQRERHFSKLVTAMSAVSVTTKPFARSSAGFKHVYEIVFDDLDVSDLPSVALFCGKLLDVLGAFSVEEVVELVAKLPNLEKQLHYE